MDHLQIEVVALFPEPIFTFRGPQGLSGIEVFRDSPSRNTTGAFRMTIGNDGWGRAELPTVSIDKTFFPADKPPIGKAAKERLRDRVTRMMRISCSTEQLPSSDNRVTLSEKRDELGLPRPQAAYRIDDYSKRSLERAHKVASAILSQTVTNAGGDPAKAEIQPPTPKPPAEFNTAAHAMGTMKMTSDPKTGVVNSFGRAYEHPNLYVLGSSVFVTSSSANPTLTIAALTLRAAAEIAKRL